MSRHTTAGLRIVSITMHRHGESTTVIGADIDTKAGENFVLKGGEKPLGRAFSFACHRGACCNLDKSSAGIRDLTTLADENELAARRVLATSSVKVVMLVQPCVMPGAVGLVTAISGMSAVPSTALTTPVSCRPFLRQPADCVLELLRGCQTRRDGLFARTPSCHFAAGSAHQ
jgi:hypothetical protein